MFITLSQSLSLYVSLSHILFLLLTSILSQTFSFLICNLYLTLFLFQCFSFLYVFFNSFCFFSHILAHFFFLSLSFSSTFYLILKYFLSLSFILTHYLSHSQTLSFSLILSLSLSLFFLCVHLFLSFPCSPFPFHIFSFLSLLLLVCLLFSAENSWKAYSFSQIFARD